MNSVKNLRMNHIHTVSQEIFHIPNKPVSSHETAERKNLMRWLVCEK